MTRTTERTQNLVTPHTREDHPKEQETETQCKQHEKHRRTYPYTGAPVWDSHNLRRGDRIGPIRASAHEHTQCREETERADTWGMAGPKTGIKFENHEHKPQHSCRPNCALIVHEDVIMIECIRPIETGECLTCDWTVAGLYPGAHPEERCASARACTGQAGHAAGTHWATPRTGSKRNTKTEPDVQRSDRLTYTPLALTTREKTGKHEMVNPASAPRDLSRDVAQECEITYATMQRLNLPTATRGSEGACLDDNFVNITKIDPRS